MIEVLSNTNLGGLLNITFLVVLFIIGCWGFVVCARLPATLKCYFNYKLEKLRAEQNTQKNTN